MRRRDVSCEIYCLPEAEEGIEVEERVSDDDGEGTAGGGVKQGEDQELKGEGEGDPPAIIEMVGELEGDAHGDGECA
jgi:hypothetical protein